MGTSFGFSLAQAEEGRSEEMKFRLDFSEQPE
jgi:hypothetical protein